MNPERQDRGVVDWIDDYNVDADRTSENIQDSALTNNPWNLVGQEYGKFHKRTKTFIRWAILVVGVAFGLNYVSAQITSAFCHWAPDPAFFCDGSTNDSEDLPEIDCPAGICSLKPGSQSRTLFRQFVSIMIGRSVHTASPEKIGRGGEPREYKG